MSFEEVEKRQVGDIKLIVSGLPTPAIVPFCDEHCSRLAYYFEKGIPMVSLAKGIDTESLKLPDELYEDFFADYKDQFTYLSGPSFAKEIVDQQITLVSLGGRSRKVLLDVASQLQTDYFKALPTYDTKGLLLGGSLKNILAIAGGIIEGLGYNHNTRAAMITRGIVEMLRFGRVFNARPETFYGLSGMGDLILTTTGDLSRNKTFGLQIAQGRKPEEIIRSTKSVVEGYKTTKAAYLLAQKYEIRARLFGGLYHVLYDGADPKSVIQEMMRVPAKFEDE